MKLEGLATNGENSFFREFRGEGTMDIWILPLAAAWI